MGTRAIVTIDKGKMDLGFKDYVWFTHNDGYPSVLGRDLVEAVQKAKGHTPDRYDEIEDRKLIDEIKKVCQEHNIDSEWTYGRKSALEQVREEFEDSSNHDLEHEYKITGTRKDIRVKHRNPRDLTDIGNFSGNWRDVARMTGMSYESFSFYYMLKGEDGNWKVEETNNKRASVSEEDPEVAWNRGTKLVDKNAPARLEILSDSEVRKEYEVGQRAKEEY